MERKEGDVWESEKDDEQQGKRRVKKKCQSLSDPKTHLNERQESEFDDVSAHVQV